MKAAPVATTAAPTPAAAAPARIAGPAPVTAEVGGALGTIQRGLTGGSPLPMPLRSRMEAGFGAGFGDVRIHSGGAAGAAAAALGAEAFASGNSIAFAPGLYRPGTTAGDALIAHELAHVVQQRRAGAGGAVQMHQALSSPGEAAEVAADRAAATVLAGGRATVGTGGLSLRDRILRRARPGAGSLAVSPALSQAPAQPGAVAPGSGPVLTPVMTARVSPAGGEVTGLGRAMPAAAPKGPDEAQVAQGATTAEGAAPASVMVAGTPAGAAAPVASPARAERRDRPPRDRAEAEDRRAEPAPEAEAERPRGGGGGGGGARRFGRNLGDRGAAAAEEARARLDRHATALGTHEGAGTRIDAARAAAEPPATAAEADGQRTQAGQLAEAEVPTPDAAAAQARAASGLAAVAPTTIEELDDFSGPAGAGTRDGLARTLAEDAARQADPVRQAMAGLSSPPPGAAPDPAVPQPEPLAAPDTAAPALGAATPPPVPDASLDASEFREDADETLAGHDVDDRTLQRAEEGPLRAIGDDKSELDAAVDSATTEARSTEARATGVASATLSAAEGEAETAMIGGRQTGQQAVSAEQDSARSSEETGERTLVEQIETTYSTAETAVNDRLGRLQTDAVEAFRDQQGARLDTFAADVRADLEAFKSRRYTGARGLYYRARDWVLSINSLPEVRDLYQRHRASYIADIDAMIATLKTGIEQSVTECRQILADARTRIDTLAEENRGSLDDAARAALDRARQGFDRMEARIEASRRAALQALDRERDRAIAEMDARLEEIRAENAGLVDRIAAAIRALAALLGQFLGLMTRITRMGIGAFLSAAASQAREGVQNHLWEQLKEAFKEWIFSKVPGLQLLLALPPNWVEMLAAMATSMIGLFVENLPAMLPAIGVAAMIWLATQLAVKLIPGAGAIMAVIDAIRAAWSLVQSLFSAATAFFQYVMTVAQPGNGAVSFARALAHGIVAAVDMVLTFLGVDALIRRVAGAILRPFGRIVQRIQTRFRQWSERRRARRGDRPGHRRERDGGRDGEDSHRRRRAEAEARRRDRDDDRRGPTRGADRNRRGDTPEARRRREREDRERRDRERLARAVRELPGRIRPLLRRGVPGLLLRARLAIWRVQYRLSALEIDRSGSGFRIEARVNPGQVVVGGITFERDELLIEIRRIAQQVARDPRVAAASREIRGGQTRSQTAAQRRSGSDTLNTPVGERTNIAGLHNVNVTAPRRRHGQVEDVTIGGAGTFRRTQQHGTARNQTISGVSGTALDYDEAQGVIGQRPRHFAEALRRIGQRTGGPVPGTDMAAAAEHVGIRFQEAQRSPAMLAHMPFEQMQLAAGQTDAAIRNHPAYGEESTRRMAAVDRNLAQRAGLDPDNPDWSQADTSRLGGRQARGSTARQIERECAYIAAAVAARGLMFNSRSEALTELRRIVFEHFSMGVQSLDGPIALGPGGD